jgi:hypothetical protein
VRCGPVLCDDGGTRAGMLMAVHMHEDAATGALYALGGYEDGWCVVAIRCASLLTSARRIAGGLTTGAPRLHRSVRLWDMRAPRAPLLTQQLHREPVLALALDARGRQGASGAADAQARTMRRDAMRCDAMRCDVMPVR